jgi:hypothetical protein
MMELDQKEIRMWLESGLGVLLCLQVGLLFQGRRMSRRLGDLQMRIAAEEASRICWVGRLNETFGLLDGRVRLLESGSPEDLRKQESTRRISTSAKEQALRLIREGEDAVMVAKKLSLRPPEVRLLAAVERAMPW